MRKRIQTIVTSISEAPILAWILPGFFLSYLVFFLFPTFLSASVMQYFQYIPSPEPIGYDLQQTLGFSRSWLSSVRTPYVGTNQYPPLASALFAPLLLLDFSAAYRAVTGLSMACYVLMTFAFPVLVSKGKGTAIVVLVLLTGLVSYSFQFELERGQFNVVSAFLALLAIWIFHYHPRYSVLAYVLFTISVQLKVYPFIFVLLLIRDWRDWSGNIRRILLLAIANVAMLFALGPVVFMDFVEATGRQTPQPYVWVGNHSITSFTTLVVQHAALYGWTWMNRYSGFIQLVFLGVVAGCLSVAVVLARRRTAPGIDAPLLLACTIGALLIPPFSHDYTLSILAAPVALFYVNAGDWHGPRAKGQYRRLCYAGSVFVLSVAYASTLFSFVYKPGTFIIGNNFLALILMLVAVTLLSWLSVANPAIPKPGQPRPAAGD